MNKIKIIELLNMISRGEEPPKKIRYQANSHKLDLYTYNEYTGDYSREIGIDLFTYLFSKERITGFLNDEVEIIEEDNKDKEIEVYINGEKVDITDIYEPLKQGEYFYKENDKWYVHKLKNVSFVIEEDKKIEKIKTLNNVGNIKELVELEDKQQINNHILKDKINEIIDIINKEEN